MNRERAAELLPIIQAFAEGKDIQCTESLTGEWHEKCSVNPHFSEIDDIKWRIKPEPFECWVNAYDDKKQSLYVYSTRRDAINGGTSLSNDPCESARTIHMREVEQ